MLNLKRVWDLQQIRLNMNASVVSFDLHLHIITNEIEGCPNNKVNLSKIRLTHLKIKFVEHRRHVLAVEIFKYTQLNDSWLQKYAFLVYNYYIFIYNYCKTKI